MQKQSLLPGVILGPLLSFALTFLVINSRDYARCKNDKTMKHGLLILFLGLLSLPLLQAQSTLSSGGGDISGPQGLVSYTIGQLTYTPEESLRGSIYQGVQLPYEVFLVSSLKEVVLFESFVYPNPAHSYLVLKVLDYPTHHLSYQLFDSFGRLLLTDTLKGNETHIPVLALPPATYLLVVSQQHQKVKSYQIIKN